MANEERHCFITEWYDSHAEIKRRYQLMHYLKVLYCSRYIELILMFSG